MSWFDVLYKRVKGEGQRPHVLTAGAGRLLITEHGARVLACELPGVDHNLFFHTDATGNGHVTGGDRLWIAPEVAYFWPTLDDALNDPKGTAATPSAVDPAEWRPRPVANQPPAGVDAVKLAAEIELHDRRNQGRGVNVAERCFRALSPWETELRQTSFSIRHSITDAARPDSAGDLAIGAWSILQIPPTGTLVCPVTRRLDRDGDIRSYYDPFGDQHVAVDDRSVRFRVDGQRRIKMGIKPEHTTGRMAYYRELGDGESSLILRVFAPLPGEPYCDLPRNDPRHRQLERGEFSGPALGGDCLQAYNDDGDAFPGTTFGEMEYHDPCVIVGRGPTSRTGSSVTHAVVGPDDAVRAFGEDLLGVPIAPLA